MSNKITIVNKDLQPYTRLEIYENYEIMYLDASNNALAGQLAPEIHAASISGGVPSHFMADMLIQQYGRESVLLWFADTCFEDPDLYRFMHDCMKRWGGRLYWYTDGRTPYQVAEQKKMIPNNRNTDCSYVLKVGPFRQFIKAMGRLPLVYIGLEAHEKRRLCSVPESYKEAIPEAKVIFPLNCPEVAALDLHAIIREQWAIETPRLYHEGYSHNNCSGRCCRQGMGEWIRTSIHHPARFEEMASWEEAQRGQGGARANRTICAIQITDENGQRTKQPITLYEVKQSKQHLLK